MPNFKENFLSIFIAFLPIFISGVFFSQAINSDIGMKTKLENILGASTTALVNSMETDTQRIGVISGIIDSIFRLDENNEAHFNKIKIRGRSSEPDLFSLEKDQSYIWLDQDMDRVFLSRFGVEKIEVLTDEFFKKDLTFKQDLEVKRDFTVNRDSNFFGGVDILGNLQGNTATLATALISGNLTVEGDSSLLGALNINNLNISGNFSGSTATLSSAYFTNRISFDLAESKLAYIYGTAGDLYISNPGDNVYISAGASDDIFFNIGNSNIVRFEKDLITLRKELLLSAPQLTIDNPFGSPNIFLNKQGTEYLRIEAKASGTVSDIYFANIAQSGGKIFLSTEGTGASSSITGYGRDVDMAQTRQFFSFNNLESYISSEKFAINNSFSIGSTSTFFNELRALGGFSAGNSSLGNTSIIGNLSAAGGAFSGNLVAGTTTLANTEILGNLKLKSNGASFIEISGGGDPDNTSFIERTSNEFRWDAGRLDGIKNVFVTSDSPHQFKKGNTVGFEIFNYLGNISALDLRISKASAQLIVTGANANIVINGKTVTTNASDSILKSGIEDYGNTLEYIKQLRTVTFNWKNPDNTSETLPGRSLGMIAQEVESVIPDLGLVAVNPDGTKYIRYDLLSAVLLEGVKAQQTQITNLSEAVGSMNLNTLQSNYDDFKSALDSLSLSTEAGSLIVNSGLTVTGNSLLNEASFTGNITVGQVKIDSLENDISTDTASCEDMDGNLNETDCDTNQLSIMKNKSGNVSMFDGKVKFKPNGEVLGEKVQAKSFKNTNTTAPSGSSSCNAGEFKFGEEDGKSYIYYCNSSSNWTRSELSTY